VMGLLLRYVPTTVAFCVALWPTGWAERSIFMAVVGTMPAYLLGLWLGHGMTNQTVRATALGLAFQSVALLLVVSYVEKRHPRQPVAPPDLT
jgi:hypothetical protein